MNEKMIKAYVDEVIKRVPKQTQDDIEKELIVLIEDEHMDGELSTEEVLNKMGDPRVLADQYADRKQYIIGPRYYQVYIRTLTLVIPIVMLAVLIANAVDFVVSGNQSGVNIIAGSFSSGLTVFAFVTIGFIVADRIDKIGYEPKTWDVGDLDLTKKEKKKMPRSEGIVAAIFTVVFFALINYTPSLFAVYNTSEGLKAVMLNIDAIDRILFWFNIALFMSFARSILKIASRHYTPVYLVLNTTLNVVGLIAMAILFSSSYLINPNFNQEMMLAGFSDTVDYVSYIERGLSILIILLVISVIAEFVKEVLKVYGAPTLKFQKKQ